MDRTRRLMMQRPGDHFAVWHFWDGDDREFVCWYLKLQTVPVRAADGYSTQDLELDIVAFPEGSYVLKDDAADERAGDAVDDERSGGVDLVAHGATNILDDVTPRSIRRRA
jgi:hypothetical protein